MQEIKTTDMMRFDSQVIGDLTLTDEQNNPKPYLLDACIIENLNVKFIRQHQDFSLAINGCVIKSLCVTGCIISGPFTVKNSTILTTIIFENTTFKERFELFGNSIQPKLIFSDCHFSNDLIIQRNILDIGSNLLGNKGDGTATTWDSEIIEEDNIGPLNLNGW